jgi:hypothetical protein
VTEETELQLPRQQPEQLRVLFAFGLTADFYAADAEHVNAMIEALGQAFDDLAGRFGATVLGGLDDDQLQVGPSPSWPWTCYILADVPSLDTVVTICNLVRETPVLEGRLWRYLTVEARVGRPLFFGTR